MSGYGSLADYYDRLMTDDYAARAQYLSALFEKHGEMPRSLLDLACGSGTLTALFAQQGIDTIGVDGSEDMLAVAAEKFSDGMWLCQDMRELDLFDVVDGAICTLDSFNHLLNTADIAAVLSRLRLFIAPSGLLIFDVNTPHKHRDVLANNTFVFEDDGLLCVWQNAYNARTCTVDMMLDFFEEADDGLYERTSDLVRERAYTIATWRRLLADAQFDLLAVYDDMTTDTATDTAERWVIVARNTRPAEEFSA